MQKALEQLNVKLTEVVSDITGVTGMAIIKAVLRGEREPQQLAKLRDPRCKPSRRTCGPSRTKAAASRSPIGRGGGSGRQTSRALMRGRGCIACAGSI